MGLWKYCKELIALYRCQHMRVQMVYGDEINARNGYRWKCYDCGVTVAKFYPDRDYKVMK